jgi:uncharacterized protein YbcI
MAPVHGEPTDAERSDIALRRVLPDAMTEEPAAAAHDVERDVAEEILRVHRESWGKGARSSHAHVLDDVVVCFLDDLELLPNEELLVEAGKGELVVEVRRRYQQAVETSFRAAVERATGRRVTSFLSVTELAPNSSVEIFRLGPAEENRLG